MAMRVWNDKTKRWEIQTTTHANKIKVRDILGNFKNSPKTVESCLEETQKTIKNIKNDIKYIYENGTIGGGGSGGGSFPKIELVGPSDVVVKTENPFTISYFFNSPNPGEGTANYVITKKNSVEPPILDIKKSIRQGRINHTFEPIPSGEYELSISVIDNTGIGSNNIVCNITCGALELTTTEEISRDISLGSSLEVTYKLSSIFKEQADVTITMPNGEVINEKKDAGTYKISIPAFESLGVKYLKIKATCESVQANELKFTFIVTDATNMFISSNFEGGTFRQDENISINYRISLLGARQFLTDVYINDQLHESNISSKSGHNFYTLKGLDLGRYTVRFESKTLETVNPIKASLTVPEFEVVSSTFKNYTFSRDSLLLSLDARKGKSNHQDASKISKWEDTEQGKPTITTLHNFAFNFLNGWVNSETNSDIDVDGLKFSGRSYAEIDLKPLSGKLTNGLTLEIRYKSFDIGADKEGNYSCILDCFKGTKFTGKGIIVNSNECFARTSFADLVSNEPNEKEWVTQTFVINPKAKEMLVYTNGSISSYAKIEETADLLVDKTITLGARNENGISSNSNCSIQTVRIYNRALNDLEVFKNFVSDLPIEEQDEIITIHEGQKQIPTLKLNFDETALGNAAATTTVSLEYSDPFDPSKNIILENSIIQKQGTTSQTYPVSNYTIKLYDAGMPFDYAPKDDWVPENIFTLKADYMDSSHANNTGIAAYASEVFRRLGVKNPAQKEDERVKNTIDGFMVNLYVNGTNRGLYNFNTDRYGAKNYGLSNTSFKSVALSYEANSNTGNATGFHTQDWNLIKGAFKVRYFKNENDQNKYLTFDQETGQMVMTQGVHGEFAKLIKWINEAGKEAVEDRTKRFYSEFKEHLDLDHTLLYMLIVEIFGLMDNFEKNMVLTYFGEQYNVSTGMLDEIWYPQLYDLDSSVGLSNNGELKYQPCVNFTQEPGMPPDHQYNGTKSLLWSSIKKMFSAELESLYAQLRRSGIINIDTIMEYYKGKTIDKVSPYLYSVDSRIKYINPSNGVSKDTYYHFCKGRRIEFTKKWLKNRIKFLDSIYKYGNENNPDGNWWKIIQARYRKKNQGDRTFTVSIKTVTPLFVMFMDDGVQADGKKYFVSNDKMYNIEIPINDASDGSMFGVTFGPDITDLNFSDNVRISSLYLEHARNLYEINITNNKDLKSIVLNNCDNLRKFNVSGCSGLGKKEDGDVGEVIQTVNFINCPNIREINIENTNLSGFLVNDNGGIIDTLNCNNSNIETFILKSQPYIKSLDIVGCGNLKKFELENCKNVTSINLPSSIIETFRVLDCPKIHTINISNTPYLNCDVDLSDPQGRTKFWIDNCPSLIKLIMSGLSNNKMKFLDLINVENIEYLDISKCGFLEEIRFSEAANKLSTLICNNSAIKNFKFGRGGVTVDYLDLGRFPLITSISFDNCGNLRRITNSTLGKKSPINGAYIFRNCKELTEISGSLYLTGSLTQSFYECAKLKNLPADLNLSGVTSASQAFAGCLLLNINEVKRILSKLINLSGSTWQMFDGCKGIISDTENKFPSDMFAYNSKITSLDQTFSNCSLSGEFPNDLFKPLVNLTYIRYPFSGAKFEVPIFKQDEMLSSCSKLETMYNPFSGMKFLRLPTSAFLANCRNLVTAEDVFYEQTQATKSSDAGEYFINENFFANNTNLKNIPYFFYNCSSITGKVPPRLFANNKKLTNLCCTFGYCKMTGSLPVDFIPVEISNGVKKSYLTNLRGTFRNTLIDGIIPNELLAEHNNVSDMSYIFYSCVNLGTKIPPNQVKFPNRIFRGKRSLSTVEAAFAECRNYNISFDSNNPDDNSLFADNINLSIISRLFENDTSLAGTLPKDIFNIKDSKGNYLPSKITQAKNVFYNTKISGYIPNELFRSFENVRYLNGFFGYCQDLEGGLPYDLFVNCINLLEVNDFLVMAWDGSPRKFGTNRDNIKEKYIDEVTGFAYIFNKDLFATCGKLESTNGFLYSVGQQLAGKVHPETFINNPELKDISGTFCNTGASAEINGNSFSSNRKITLVSRFLYSAKGPCTITEDAFDKNIHNYIWRNQSGNIIVKDFGAAFAHCNLTGTAPRLWEIFPNAKGEASGVKCFENSNLTNSEDIPLTWK